MLPKSVFFASMSQSTLFYAFSRMSKRSYKVAKQHIASVQDSFRRSGFASQQAFATEVGISVSTLKIFLKGGGIDRLNFIECCEKLGLDWQEVVEKPSKTENNPDFVGRESAIADLNDLDAKGAKVILIRAAGGVGKTTLAEQYLKQRFGAEPLKFKVATTRSTNTTITSVDGVLKEWLKDLSPRDYDSNITFKEALKQLKEKLTEKPIGILVDNLEPALLDNGRFIETHQESYLELLEVLYSQEVKSVALITSRFKLSEPTLVRPKFCSYPLKALTWEDWKTYFQQQSENIVIDDNSLQKIHKYYYGNALAMELVAERVSEEKISFETYWQRSNKRNRVTPEQGIKNLIFEEFEFLKSRNQLAYDLLCRLSCYRYQEVPEIPDEAFECLFWNDETDEEKDDAIQYLLDNTAYINRGEQQHTYFLHRLIIEEGRRRIKQNKLDWEKANRQAAEFWTTSVETIKTIEDAKQAFEAYYHYLSIEYVEQAFGVIVRRRPSTWKWYDLDGGGEILGNACRRLGLHDKIISSIESIEIISSIKSIEDFRLNSPSINQYNLSLAYKLLGDFYWIKGNLHSAQKYNDIALIFIKECLVEGDENYRVSKRYYFSILVTKLLCNIELLEIDSSIPLLEKVIQEIEKEIESEFGLVEKKTSLFYNFYVECYFCLAFLYSCTGEYERANIYLEELEKLSNFDDSRGLLNEWCYAHLNLYLGYTFKNLNRFDKAKEKYEKIKQEIDYYPQVKGKGLTGLGELYRIQKDYNTALDHHFQSIKILKEIGAKCDLAEAYFQLALTYQAMGDQPNSQTYFDKALKLWGPEQIDAPKQIERVKKAMQTIP